jgi:hypothetical protein
MAPKSVFALAWNVVNRLCDNAYACVLRGKGEGKDIPVHFIKA